MQRVKALVLSGTLHWSAILALSLAYYAFYLNSGFNFSDAGNYAQICFELLLGRDPNEFAINYGILWFKIGQILFYLFGADFGLIKLLFFFCIIVTNILVFYTVHLATSSRLLAFGAAVTTMLVPAFPPTSFYALCVMLNVAVQMRLIQKHASPWHAILAGAVLAFTFQIRPDFGYVFVVPLAVVIILASYASVSRSDNSTRIQFGKNLGFSALGGFVSVLVIGLIASVIGGYTDVLLRQFMEYPTMMAGYLLDGIRQLTAGPAPSGLYVPELLQRPNLVDILSGDWGNAQLSLLIYLPTLLFIIFVLFNVPLFFRFLNNHQKGPFTQNIVALSAALATFPHYFFYRPDMSHIANFMPGYIVLVAIFVSQIYGHIRSGNQKWRRFGAASIFFLLALNIGIYLWVGMQSPATGSIAVAIERTEKFSADNGVDVLVTPVEKSDLEFLQDVIVQNSLRGDAIVCVPYCPGVAFMTARKMLLPNFYVDDTYLLQKPDWLPSAINLISESSPAVIIVIDWAINGTEQSRFTNWASPFITVVEELANTKITRGSITAYVL